jgi:glycosyltransferase involved in cell wall biosynthesis
VIKNLSKYKLACLVSHPIQYQVPLFRKISQDPRFDLEVIYCSGKSIKSYLDQGFNREINWDIPLMGGYRHIFLPKLFESTRPGFFNPLSYGIYSILKKRNFDAIWIHGWSNWAQLSTIIIARLLGIKVLIRGESGIHLKKPTGIKKAVRFIIITFLKKTIDGFLAIGTNNKDYYLAHGILPEKIFPVPYAVDNHFFLEQSQNLTGDSLKIREKLSDNIEVTVILFSSKLENRKRADFLINAFAKLCNQRDLKNLPILVIIGDGPERQRIEEKITKMNLGNIFLLGFKNQTELPMYYSMADIFVLPSKQEPWGLVVNEVMNTSCAVIVSDEVGCAKDLVVHGETGLVFRSDSEMELVNCLFELCSDIGKRNKLALRAKERISKWSYQEGINGLHLALESVCSK